MDREKLSKCSEYFRNAILDSEESSEYHSILVKNIIGLGVSLFSLSYTIEYSKRFDSYKSVYGKIVKFAFLAFLPVLISGGIRTYYIYPFYEKIYNKHHPFEGSQPLEEEGKAESSFN